MDELQLLIDLHRPNLRLGPGSAEHTRQALALAGLPGRSHLRIADLGCGTGASTLVLADALDAAHITAVDLFPAFLEQLEAQAVQRGVQDRITLLASSFEALPLAPGSFDVVWSEGAIYNLGFRAGVAAWRRLLVPGGILAVSEITWLTATPPAALRTHWEAQYPEIGPASSKLAVLEQEGFSPVGYFTLPESCWLANYYRPLQARFPAFLEEHGGSPAAHALVAAEEQEIALYEQHRSHVSYGFYIAQRVDPCP